MSNCQQAFMYLDPTYGEFMNALKDKADQRSSDFDENEKSGFDPTATASFSFYLYKDSDDGNVERDVNHNGKVVKCGVHLLYTYETKRFKSNQEEEKPFILNPIMKKARNHSLRELGYKKKFTFALSYARSCY
ncbi:uncharacterized protein LOC112092207 [Morus notabilis]|uniref:uncharacterized protein LOC112092207 n=1 Tax=Morus notabilis TaxID=981085 RepID=UPI000CED7192|nr:uncharacterized protein LOC112092207 [Morus notabilis]